MHLLVVANETVTGRALIEAVERRKDSDLRVTVISPVNQPERSLVVYEDTRRAAAGRRLDRTLTMLRNEGIPAHGIVVETDPVTAVRDALAQLDPPVDEIVLANETVVGKPLLERIRERAARGAASFLIISPQSDPTKASHPEAERRLRRAVGELRSESIDAHGQVAHPDPFTAAMEAIGQERVDEIIVSTFAPSRSPWMRKNLVQRLHEETKLPVEHVVFQPEEVEREVPA